MPNISSLETLLYDPLSWIAKERFSSHEIFNNPACQSLINQALARQFGLTNDIPTIIPGSLTELFVRHWLSLTELSKLLASRRYRAALMYQGEFELLPVNTQKFCLIDFGDLQPIRPGLPIKEEDLYACGMQMLMSLSSHLPLAVTQRIPLLFSESVMNIQISPVPWALSPLDFKLAIQHAQFSPSV